MTRVFLQFVLPFLVPFLVYLAWWWFTRKRIEGGRGPLLQDTPWFWLVLSGFVLMTGGLVTTALTSGVGPESRLTAPRYEDGRIVPAQIK